MQEETQQVWIDYKKTLCKSCSEVKREIQETRWKKKEKALCI